MSRLTVEMLRNDVDTVKEIYEKDPMKLHSDILLLINGCTKTAHALYKPYGQWVNNKTVGHTADPTTFNSIDSDVTFKFISTVEPRFRGWEWIKTNDDMLEYFRLSSKTMFRRFGIPLNDDDQKKFASDMFSYFQENRDKVIIEPFFEAKKDNKVSQYIESEKLKGNNNIYLYYKIYCKEIDTDNDVIYWFLANTCTVSGGERVQLVFRI